MSFATKRILTPKNIGKRSFLNISIKDKGVLTCMIDNHLLVGYLKGLVFNCAIPEDSSKKATVKIEKGRKERSEF